MELFLARMLILLEGDPAKNRVISIKRNGAGPLKNLTVEDKPVPKDAILNRLEDSTLQKFYFGEKLIFTWKKTVHLYEQKTLNVKYL